MTRFVILAAPRTGSNLLCTLLNSHAQILCHHEVFNPQGVFTARDFDSRELAVESLQQRDHDPINFLHRVWQTCGDNSCVGFKWTRGQNPDVLQSVVKDAEVKKIVLHRRNRIKTFVSEKVAQQTQQWEVYSPADLVVPRPRICVDSAELLEHIAVNQQFYAQLTANLLRLGQPHLETEYERLFERSEQQRLLEFLGVRATDGQLMATSVKQNSMDLRQTIANFDELNASLSDRELATELHDRSL